MKKVELGFVAILAWTIVVFSDGVLPNVEKMIVLQHNDGRSILMCTVDQSVVNCADDEGLLYISAELENQKSQGRNFSFSDALACSSSDEVYTNNFRVLNGSSKTVVLFLHTADAVDLEHKYTTRRQFTSACYQGVELARDVIGNVRKFFADETLVDAIPRIKLPSKPQPDLTLPIVVAVAQLTELVANSTSSDLLDTESVVSDASSSVGKKKPAIRKKKTTKGLDLMSNLTVVDMVKRVEKMVKAQHEQKLRSRSQFRRA